MKKVDIVEYCALIRAREEGRVAIEALPEKIKNKLFKHKKYNPADGVIAVDSADKETQAFLNEYFDINGLRSERKFLKGRWVEISEDSIDQYPFYRIEPRDCISNYYRDFIRPTCQDWHHCPVGGKRISPIRVHPKLVKDKLFFGQVSIWPEVGVELFVSPALKLLFDENNVTGLEYEPCTLGTETRERPTDEPPCYVASIHPKTYYTADKIDPGSNHCPTHNIVTRSALLFNERLPYDRLSDVDFQMITSARDDSNEYFFVDPMWLVSARVLRILLDVKVKGLMLLTCILDERFLPLVNMED